MSFYRAPHAAYRRPQQHAGRKRENLSGQSRLSATEMKKERGGRAVLYACMCTCRQKLATLQLRPRAADVQTGITALRGRGIKTS